MSEDDKRNCCLLEIQETEAKYYRTLEDIEKVGVGRGPGAVLSPGSMALWALASGTPCPPLPTQASILSTVTLVPGSLPPGSWTAPSWSPLPFLA